MGRERKSAKQGLHNSAEIDTCATVPAMSEATSAAPISWEAVKALAMVVGVREAARRMELSEEQVKKRCTREGWLSDPRARLAATNAVALRSGISAPVPTSPMSPAALIAQEMAELNSSTRLGHARAAKAVASHVQTLNGQELLADMSNVKAAAQHASTTFAWADQQPASRVRLEVLLAKPEQTTIECDAQVVDGEWNDADMAGDTPAP